jgi:pilus assembly protein Flp/PilA
LTHQIFPNQGESKMERIKNFIKDESGASAVEYGLLVGLIAVFLITAIGLLGSSINSQFLERAATLAASVAGS